MAKPKKAIEEKDLDTADMAQEPESEMVQEYVPVMAEENGKVAYIKNGVTRLRYPSEEKELFAQGWARK